jgi:hypothetical protein
MNSTCFETFHKPGRNYYRYHVPKHYLCARLVELSIKNVLLMQSPDARSQVDLKYFAFQGSRTGRDPAMLKGASRMSLQGGGEINLIGCQQI